MSEPMDSPEVENDGITWATIPLSWSGRDAAEELANRAGVSYDDYLDKLLHEALQEQIRLSV